MVKFGSHHHSHLTNWVGILSHLSQEAKWHAIHMPGLRNLYKSIILEHYKAPSLSEICHHLTGATTFSKLDAKDGFWSVHLHEKSSYLTTFNTHPQGEVLVPAHSFWPEDVPGYFPDAHQPGHLTSYSALSCYIMTFTSTARPCRSMTGTLFSWCRLPLPWGTVE